MSVQTKVDLKSAIDILLVPGGEVQAEQLKAKLFDIIDSSAWGTDITSQHSHANKSLLDLLSDIGGELAYDGGVIKITQLAWSAITGKPLGVASGVATLDGAGKIPIEQIPEVLAGALSYQGTYNANLNDPTLPAASSGNNGYYYKVSVAGSQDLGAGVVAMTVGDIIISNGSFWEKIDGASELPDWTDVQNKPTEFNPEAHEHDAADITSGVLDPARIPVIATQIQVVSSGAIADLTSPQQDEIEQGAIVTTTDGRRWIYTGTGSKVSEASYIEAADVTPDWSVIANKPSTFAPSAHNHAASEITSGNLDYARLPVVSNVTGSTAVSFTSHKLYGTYGTPLTGNITYNFTGAISGTVVMMIHNDSTEPTLPGTETILIGGEYVTDADNFIWMTFYNDGSVNRVHINITQQI